MNGKLTMNNGKEYIIKNDIRDMEEMVNQVSSTKSERTISSWDLSERDLNSCKSVIVFSKSISSIEYNLIHITSKYN